MKHVRELIPKKEDRILIVAPHPDDEAIGCGGFIIKYHDQIDILLLTAGEADPDPEVLKEKKERRLKEFDSAIEFVGGVHSVISLDLPLNGVKKNRKRIKKVNIKGYQYIFVTHRGEHHADHKCLYPIFKKMIFWQRSKAILVEYESTTALQLLYYYTDLSDPEILEKKNEMMYLYHSQVSGGFNYAGILKGLSMYQGALIHKDNAEVYYRVPSFFFLKKIYSALPGGIKKRIAGLYYRLKKSE